MQGHVVWFNNGKGYGFLVDEATLKEYFVHYKSIQCEGYKTLKESQKVSFDTEIGEKGKLQACNVVAVR
jgi:cold shock protein